jgi:hypothetical protein
MTSVLRHKGKNACFNGSIPCFYKKYSLTRSKQGTATKDLEIVASFYIDNRKNSRKVMKFPVIFPVLRESRTSILRGL